MDNAGHSITGLQGRHGAGYELPTLPVLDDSVIVAVLHVLQCNMVREGGREEEETETDRDRERDKRGRETERGFWFPFKTILFDYPLPGILILVLRGKLLRAVGSNKFRSKFFHYFSRDLQRR